MPGCALLGIVVIPALGWRAMFVIGALPALVLVPLIVRYLPESESFLQDKARERHNPIAILFGGGYLRATIAFWVTSFMGLLLVYGLNTWLPEIMRSAGYELGAALALLLVLNVGAILGLLVAGQVALTAIEFALLSDQVNAVRAVHSGRHMQVFTSGAEWMVSGEPLTPKTVQARRQTRIGSRIDRCIPPRSIAAFVRRSSFASWRCRPTPIWC